MVYRTALAALNNAEWCDAVSAAHGADCRFEDGFWVNPGAAPPFYPNLVTLDPAAASSQNRAVEGLLATRDGGFGVKDSFATLDLSPLGLVEAFAAEWLWLDPATAIPAAGDDCRRFDSAAALSQWEAAWRGSDSGETLFLPALLNDPRIAFLALERGGGIVAGVALNRSDQVLGLSNLFHADDDDAALPALLTAARRFAPGLPIVGYEHGASLAAFRAIGFEAIGPLRVFVRG